MKFSEQWLREWVDPSLNTEQLVEQLTMIGLEVDTCEPVATEFSGVIVAHVLHVEKHPDADKLSLCQVSTGDDQKPLQIVCGAANVRQGLKVPLATIGARLPGDFKIKKGKLRGQESHGMICSSSELGLAESSDGIMELAVDALVGQDFREYLQLDDHAIDIELTPNRGDCLGILGVAREVSTATKTPLKQQAMTEIEPVNKDCLAISLKSESGCPRYVGRIIRNIDPLANTPIWMIERLRRSGLRHVSPVVDVTNYVMLELGQPLHAFDLAKLDREIIVRKAKQDEQLTLLNGQELHLRSDTLVIADASKALAIAGVMGGEDSSVGSHTKDIFLEGAFFTPVAIAGVARSYGMHTDSAYRFERGVDPELPRRAIERATELLIAIVGGEPGPVTEVSARDHLPKTETIALTEQRVTRIIGMEFSAEVITDILQRLHFKVKQQAKTWQVEVPSYRFDINRDVDVIEEIIRLYGYQNIPDHFPTIPLQQRIPSETLINKMHIRACLVTLGYQEAISYSFVDAKLQQLLDPAYSALSLVNPISPELAVMRTNLWPGLVQTILYNLNRQQSRLRLFEIGQRFRKANDELQQQQVLAGIVTGTRKPVQWCEREQLVDFYDIKGDVEAILSLTGKAKDFIFKEVKHDALHPGQSCAIEYSGHQIGLLGALHPEIKRKLDLPHATFVFEIDLQAVTKKRLPTYQKVSRFPEIRRDLAIVVTQHIPASDIYSAIVEQGGELLTELVLFDVYQGQGVEAGKKSLAFSLTLQHQQRTLVDDEVANYLQDMMAMLATRFNAILRD